MPRVMQRSSALKSETLSNGMLDQLLVIPAEQIAPDRRLDEYGLDSLMATELLVTTRARFNVDIPPMELIRGAGTVDDIASIVLTRLGIQGSRTAPS